MKRLSLALLSVALAAASSFASEERSIFDRYPQTETVRLKSGESVALPVHYQDFTMGSLIGYGNYDEVRAELKGNDLEPLRFSGNRAMIVLYAFDYARSSLGKYHEAVIGIPIANAQTPKNRPLRSLNEFFSSFLPSAKDPRKPKPYSLYVYKIFVDSDLGRRAGDEIWGFHKEMGTIELEKSERSFSLSVAASTCAFAVKVNARTPVFLPTALNFPLFTSGLKDAPTTGSAKSALGIAGKAVAFESSLDCGGFFANTNFKPSLWQFGKDGKLVLFKTVRD